MSKMLVTISQIQSLTPSAFKITGLLIVINPRKSIQIPITNGIKIMVNNG